MSGEIVQYEHHGAQVFVREDLKGRHRDHCLCFQCARFKPGEPDNCYLAQTLYDLCVEQNMVTPVWECPDFSARAKDAFAQQKVDILV